jgi:hypothetical protein
VKKHTLIDTCRGVARFLTAREPAIPGVQGQVQGSYGSQVWDQRRLKPRTMRTTPQLAPIVPGGAMSTNGRKDHA